MGLIDNLSLAIISLGASGAAMILALYLLRKEAGVSTKDSGPLTPKSPPLASAESIGVLLKRRLDKE